MCVHVNDDHLLTKLMQFIDFGNRFLEVTNRRVYVESGIIGEQQLSVMSELVSECVSE